MQRTLQRQLFARRILWMIIGPDACKYFKFPWCEKASEKLNRAELVAAGPEPPSPAPAPPAPPGPPPPGPPEPAPGPEPAIPEPAPPKGIPQGKGGIMDIETVHWQPELTPEQIQYQITYLQRFVPIIAAQPPIYVAPWEPGPPHRPQPAPIAGWSSIFNNTKWIGYGTGDCTVITCWDGTKWVQAVNSPYVRLKTIGTWPNGLRPTKARFEISDPGGVESFIKIRDNSYNVIGEISGLYEQLSEITLDFSGTGDIYELYLEYNDKPPPTRHCTRIEFYLE